MISNEAGRQSIYRLALPLSFLSVTFENNEGVRMAKALVVDDSRAVRMILAKALMDLGYEVREAGNGREALEIMEVEKTSVNLVLADWNMPELNGLEMLRQLRRDPALSSLVVVMVTSETEMDQVATALEAGANEYVMKPFTKDILIEKLNLARIHPCGVQHGSIE